MSKEKELSIARELYKNTVIIDAWDSLPQNSQFYWCEQAERVMMAIIRAGYRVTREIEGNKVSGDASKY